MQRTKHVPGPLRSNTSESGFRDIKVGRKNRHNECSNDQEADKGVETKDWCT